MELEKKQLETNSSHQIYYEISKNINKADFAFLFVHGGPGGGVQKSDYNLFQNSHLPVCFVDQRGSGRSKPLGETKNNTTWDLIEDFESIRKKHDVKKWLLCGGSWGSTLSITYAIHHPKIIDSLILWGIFFCSQKDLNWFYQFGANILFPDEYEKYTSWMSGAQKKEVLKSFYKEIHQEDDNKAWEAVKKWVRWEAVNSFLQCEEKDIKRFLDKTTAIPMAKLETQYFINGAFFPEDDYILKNIRTIENIPLEIVQGRYDTICPMDSAWRLHKAMPKSKLHISPTASHDASEKENLSQIKTIIKQVSKTFS